MNFTNVLMGNDGIEAAGFSKSVVLNQLGFDLQRALFAATNQNEKPVFDTAVAGILGDMGVPDRIELNADELLEGYASAFVLLARHTKDVFAETGRRPEHLIRYLKQPTTVISEGITYRMERQKLQIQATAAMLNADAGPRLAVVAKEMQVQADAIQKPVMEAFVKHLKIMQAWDNEKLIETACEALVNAGRNPALELKRAANALLDSQKKRFAEGQYVQIDPAMYALAGAVVGTGAPTKETSGADVAALAAEVEKSVADAKAASKRRAALKRALKKAEKKAQG